MLGAAEREGRYAEPVDDTSAAAERRYFELLRLKSPSERLAIAVRLSHAVRELAVAGVKQREPHATPREIRRGLAERLYGAEVLRVSAPDLDSTYLDHWAPRLGLMVLLARARREAG